MWESLRQELHPQGFEVITVALDSGGAEKAGEWIRRANPSHPSLIDTRHLVADLYNMTNVPTTVWIDEEGRVVRPNDPGFASDAFRSMRNPDPAAQEQLRAQARARREQYLDAIRDWVAHGPTSVYALSAEDVRRRTAPSPPEHALAAAHFRLGEYLYEQGHAADAVPHFKEAQRLRPESWAYKRQAWQLGDAERDYGTTFWAEVEKLGDRPYYAPLEMPGTDRAG